MQQTDLVTELDSFFHVANFDESDRRSAFPADYGEVFARYVTASFLEGTWNGLMLDNATDVGRVYLAVFPSVEALDTIIAREVERGTPGALIFSHHIMDYEEGGRGFVPISENQLADLREFNISYYACHAPLDCHPEISTANAWADALKLKERVRFIYHVNGYAGIHGKLPAPMNLHEFGRLLTDLMELPNLRYDQIHHAGHKVRHVALVPGGGDDPAVIGEAQETGADTYLTGLWWLHGPGDFPKKRRAEVKDFLPQVTMNLVGTSHYASELLVMRDQLPGLFRPFGLEVRLIRQVDPWR